LPATLSDIRALTTDPSGPDNLTAASVNGGTLLDWKKNKKNKTINKKMKKKMRTLKKLLQKKK